MKILIDMNLSPTWTDCLEKIGIEATHWSKIGPADAPDSEIMKWASHHGYAVFTHDLDFGALLYLTVALKPSVIQIRAEDVRPVTMANCVCSAIMQTLHDLQQGALVTIEPRKNRVSLLPLKRS